jgi:uncharacterized protein
MFRTLILNLPRTLASLPILAYRLFVSPFKPKTCRFLPSCSDYALEAVRVHGPLKGGYLAIHRVCRCHPFGGWQCDPVPPKRGN